MLDKSPAGRAVYSGFAVSSPARLASSVGSMPGSLPFDIHISTSAPAIHGLARHSTNGFGNSGNGSYTNANSTQTALPARSWALADPWAEFARASPHGKPPRHLPPSLPMNDILGRPGWKRKKIQPGWEIYGEICNFDRYNEMIMQNIALDGMGMDAEEAVEIYEALSEQYPEVYAKKADEVGELLEEISKKMETEKTG